IRAADSRATDDDLRIKGVFETALPKTERKSSLRLIVHPHLGDFSERDHLRTELGIRYGLTDHWEATAEMETFFTHGLKQGGFFSDYGLSGLHLGTKYQLGRSMIPGWETALGIDWSRPTGRPPMDVTDGLRHIAPFVTFSRQLESHPAWRVFFGGGYEDVAYTSIPGLLRKNQLDADNVGVTGGFLYNHGAFTYSLEAGYNTEHPTEDIGKDVLLLRPGVVWVVPERYTFGAKGKWLLGLSLRLSHGRDGNDIGAGAKLRVNFDFKRLLGRKQEPASPP
ncbi:MAG TPA: hypothetical protein VG734_20440, partial [Lacunisphaera sp.]|nr:hypothetical protein [Lacunisphaera sp.]